MTEEEKDAVLQMWGWGISSVKIANAIGVTRNAVMGRINKIGFIGKKGFYLDKVRHGCLIDHEEMRKDALSLIYEEGVFDEENRLHRNSLVALAALYLGRDEAHVAKAVGLSIDLVRKANDDLHQSGAWRIGEAPNWEWWDKGGRSMSFLFDIMASTGLIAISDGKERRYMAAGHT